MINPRSFQGGGGAVHGKGMKKIQRKRWNIAWVRETTKTVGHSPPRAAAGRSKEKEARLPVRLTHARRDPMPPAFRGHDQKRRLSCMKTRGERIKGERKVK